MITPQVARMLTRYNTWANKLIFDAVAGLPGDEATKERHSLFKNMVHTLNHNYVIDLIWQAHLEGREHGFAVRNTPGHPPLAELSLPDERSEEHTSELQSRSDLVCRLLLEKKNMTSQTARVY